MYDIVIIGGGPAGLSCGIYAKRAGFNVLIIEKAFFGGQMTTTFTIQNYPGVKDIGGYDLSQNMHATAQELGCEFLEDEVLNININDKVKEIITNNKKIEAKTIVLAMGATRRKLGVVGEEEFSGMGVSYCATCDGAFFKEKAVAVVGGGNTALEDAVYLSKFASKIYLIHRRDEFRGSKHLVDIAVKNERITILYDSVLEKITGDFKVTSIDVKNVKTNNVTQYNVDGVFIAVGTEPQTDIVNGIIEVDDLGYIVSDETLVTNQPGIFVAGDIRQKELRQVVTAASDGAIAAHMAGKYINKNFD